MPDARRQAAEGHFTRLRITELWARPVEGSFDAAHLLEINRRIFQDLPGAGFADVRPGVFRPDLTADSGDWIKRRDMGELPAITVAYSRMDKTAINRLDRALEKADPLALSRLDTPAFTRKIARLYTEVDYVHPFPDGNSRTLREFTRQLAVEAGHKIDWSRFDAGEAGRKILWIARDLSVNRIALPLMRAERTRHEVAFMLDQYGGNRDLAALMADAVTRMGSLDVSQK